jgi:glycosyltransferase involved in cell wall biosynthesis
MNITQINNSIGKSFGGVPIVISTLAKGLTDKGHIVNLICNRFDDNELQENENVNLYILDNNYFHTLKGLNELLCKINTDVIHIHSYKSLNPFLVIYGKKRHNIPIVFSPHYHPTGNHPRIIRKIFDFTMGSYALKNADSILTLTDYEAELISNKCDKGSVQIVPNPFYPDKRQFSDIEITEFRKKWGIKDKNVLYVGRIAKHKGIDVLLQAFSKACLNLDEISLLIVGEDNGAYNDLYRLQKHLGMKSIRFTGKLSNNDLAKAYTLSNILVLPSSYEAFGMVLLEAMSYGVPVIGTNVGGIPYVLQDGKCGLMVEYGNIDQLAQSIIFLIQNISSKNKYIERGHERTNHFEIDKIINQLVSLYQKVI